MSTAASFASLAWGWIIAFMIWIVREVHGHGFGYVTDFAFMLAWPATFIAIAWLAIVLPALHQPWIGAQLSSSKTSWIAWPLLALASYGLLVATWLEGAGALFWFPAVVGAVAGLVFPLLRRSQRPALVGAAPIAAILAGAFVLWPALEVLSPYTTYVYGAAGSRSRSFVRILAGVHPGDSFSDLASRYPKIFSTPTKAMVGNSSSSGHAFTYRIEFDDAGGAVGRVEITPIREPGKAGRSDPR
jgi:hypothetical protein